LYKFNSNKFARIISTLLVPPSFTLLIFIFYAFHFETITLKIIETISVSTFFGFILPILLFIILKKKNKIVDMDASIKEERTFPFLIASTFYAAGLVLMILMQLNIVTIAFWFCYLTNTLLTIIINHYWKISAHAMGVSGALAALFFAISFSAFLFLPLVFVVAWSRIKLKCHNFSQVAAGIILAFTSTYLQMYLIINYFS
jgi:membrane-associated phospholipid phosphatase